MGILALQGFKELPEYFWLGLFSLIPIIKFLAPPTFLNKIVWFSLGLVWAWLHAWWILSASLPVVVEGKNIEVTGYIASMPVKRGRIKRFEFDVENARYKDRTIKIPRKLRLNWYGKAPELSAGDKWQFVVRLKRPHGFMNPGGFDYEKWLFSQGIRATGYVRAQQGNILLGSHWSDYPVQRLRQELLQKVQSWLPQHPMQGIVSALILGHREQISQQQWQTFRRTGTNHLVAISGLHIGLVAGLVFFIVRALWSRLGNLSLYLPAPHAAAIISFTVAAAYAALAGWSLPTQRALIMIGVLMMALLAKRHIQPSYGLSLALILVLLYDPLAVLSVGFWLSFGAVSLIFLTMQGKRNGHVWWNKWFRIQWVVALGLLPVLVLFFQQASVIAPVANFVAVPVVSLLVVPILLGGVLLSGILPSLGQILFSIAAKVLSYLSTFLEQLAEGPFAVWSGASPDIFILLVSIMAIGIFLFAPLRTERWLGLVLLMPLLFHQTSKPGQGEIDFTLLDVGQGLAAVIQTQNHAMVFDTGPRFSDSFDTGSAVLVPFLRQRQIHTLDLLMVSHGDNDHIGGVSSLLQAVPVKQVYSSAPTLLKRNVATICERGVKWQWDGVEFRILHPDYVNLDKKENNQSCVLYIKGPSASILLPGDIERDAESQLVERNKGGLQADILVAPHHGSKTSSTDSFIQAVRPEVVLYPVGYRNRYHFPYHKVAERYQRLGIKAFDTATSGAIHFRLGQVTSQMEPELSRQRQQAYWHHTITE